MVVNGVVINKDFQGKRREEFCSFDSEGNWVCIVALLDPKIKIRKIRTRYVQDPFIVYAIGANYGSP